MIRLDELIAEIKTNSGVRVITDSRGRSPQNEFNTFIAIANAKLDYKGTEYNPSEAAPVIKKLISLTYQAAWYPDLSLRKGILLKGSCGRGKTFLMECYAQYLKTTPMKLMIGGKVEPAIMSIVSARTIAAEYAKDGYEVIQNYASKRMLCIDDLGTESETKNYGNRSSVVADIIDLRDRKGMLTFGTTNLNALSDVYDDRSMSRMQSLFNIEILDGKTDYRTK